MTTRVTWVPPDGGWGWVIVVCSMMLHAHSIGCLLSMGVMYVSWLEAFDDGRGVTSWIISIAFAVCFGLGPIPAALANLYGFRVVTVAGGLLSAAGFILCYFATSVSFLVVTIGLLSGIGCCFMYLSGVAIVSVYFSKRRSVAMGIGASGGGIGVLVGGPMLNYLINTYGWRGALLITGAFQLHVCIFGLLIRPLEKVEIWDEDDNDENDDDNISVIQEKNLIEKKSFVGDNYTSIEDVNHTPDQSLIQIRTHVIGDNGEFRPNSQHQSNNSLIASHLKPPNGYMKVSNGSLTNSNVSLQQSHRSLMGPRLLALTHNPNHQMAASMMKIHNGSLISVNKPKVYCSLRSLNSNGKRSNFRMVNGHVLDPRFNCSMDVVLARSIKHLRSISLLGALPHRLIESIEEIKDTSTSMDSVGTKALENIEGEASHKENKTWRENLKEIIRHNIEMLRDPTFLQFAISNIATNLAYAPPVMYLVDRAVDSNLDKSVGATLIALNGVGNICGRLFFGFITYRLLKDRLMTYVAVLTAAGAFTALSPLCGGSVVLHGAYATIIGVLLGGYCTLVAVTTVDIMGLEKASASFGLLLTFMGLSTLVGPPIGGLLFDQTKSYTWTYIIYGISLIASALILLPIACIQRRKRKEGESMYELEVEAEQEKD